MKEEIFKRIDALAAKLGVASEHVWRIMVQQAKIEAIENLVGFVVFAIIAVLSVRWFLWALHSKRKSTYQDESYYECHMGAAGLIGGLALIPTFVCLFSIATPLFNPEYWALKQVLDAMK